MTESNLGRLLIVDDEVELMTALREALTEQGYDAVGFTSGGDALEALQEREFDLLLADLMMPEMDGITLFRAALESDPDLVSIIMTGHGTVQTAVEAMKAGAFDYVLKPFKLQTLLPVLARALHVRHLRRENLSLRETVGIYELTHAIAFALDPNTILNKVADAALQQCEADEAIILLPAADGSEFYVSAVRGEHSRHVLGAHVPLDQGIAGWVAKHREPLLIGGQSPDPGVASVTTHPEARYTIALPMMVGGKLIGILTINANRRQRPFTLGQVKALSILAGTGAAALESAWLYTARKQAEESLKKQLSHMSLLNQITRATAERMDLESLFRVVMHHLETYLPIDFGGILTHDAERDSFIVLVRGAKSRLFAHELGIQEGAVIPIAQTPFGACLHGETHYTPNLEESDCPLAQKLVQAGIRSEMALPIMTDKEVLGVMVVARQQEHGFSPEEGAFLQQLTEQVALAAHQARLYQELQKAYEDLRQTQQAVMQQERLRALGQMASGIVHDINNALSPIVGYTELLLRLESGLSDQARRFLETVKTAGMDITHIVARMREFYRQRDKTDHLFPVNLNAVAQQVIDLTRPRWRDIPQEHGITINVRTDLQENLPPVMGSESEIREALTNLVFNAVDAMPTGGTLMIRTRAAAQVPGMKWKKPKESPDSALDRFPSLLIEVSDTGIGMNEETRRRCLEPFYSTKGERGTGLGLAMVYGVMERHGGEIEIESEIGRGTSVRLMIPLRETESATVEEPETLAPVAPLRILFIDDEPLVRQLVKEILQTDGHEVVAADAGESGINTFQMAMTQGEPFDLVITDLGMPYVDGRAVAKTVKAISPDTPVVLLTGWGSRLVAEDRLPQYVDGVLNKPPRITELRRMVTLYSQVKARV